MPTLLSSIKRFIGTSGERKTLDCQDGSTFFETDTGDLYVFREGVWSLKEELNLTLRIEVKHLLSELLQEARKANEMLCLLTDSLGG